MAINLQALKDELVNDPTGRNYAQMPDDATRAADLNAKRIEVNVRSVTREQLFECFDSAELAAKSAVQVARLALILALPIVATTGLARNIILEVFPTGASGNATRAKLTALAATKEMISRVEELPAIGVLAVTPSEVAEAMRL